MGNPEPNTTNSPRQPASPPTAELHSVAPEQPSIVTLFHAEESALLHFAHSIVRRREVAEEVVQESFLRLHQQFSEVENPRAWLYRCVRNLALNHLRDHQRETLDDATDDQPGDSQPDREAGRNEAVGMVRLLIAEMPEQDRELIQLKYHDDKKYSEISSQTGISVSNVGYRLHHLLKSLADTLRQAGIQDSRG